MVIRFFGLGSKNWMTHPRSAHVLGVKKLNKKIEKTEK
jgi:hypothetical protein